MHEKLFFSYVYPYIALVGIFSKSVRKTINQGSLCERLKINSPGQQNSIQEVALLNLKLNQKSK